MSSKLPITNVMSLDQRCLQGVKALDSEPLKWNRVILRRLSRDCSATFFEMLPVLVKTSRKSRLTVGLWERDIQMTGARQFSDFFVFSVLSETSRKSCLTVVRWSHGCPTIVAQLFSNFFEIFKTLAEPQRKSRSTVWRWSRDRPTTAAQLFSGIFEIFPILVETSRKSRLTVRRWSRFTTVKLINMNENII